MSNPSPPESQLARLEMSLVLKGRIKYYGSRKIEAFELGMHERAERFAAMEDTAMSLLEEFDRIFKI